MPKSLFLSFVELENYMRFLVGFTIRKGLGFWVAFTLFFYDGFFIIRQLCFYFSRSFYFLGGNGDGVFYYFIFVSFASLFFRYGFSSLFSYFFLDVLHGFSLGSSKASFN